MWVGFFKFTAWWKPLAVMYILRSVMLPLISDFFLYKAGCLSGETQLQKSLRLM